MRAIVVGDRWAVSRGMNDKFARAGVSHLLAVSGLHHGLVASMVYLLALAIFKTDERIMLNFNIRRMAAAATIVPLTLYALLTGWRIPTIRAAIMVITYMLAMVLGREKDLPSSIALAALIILAAWPASIVEAGFIFSFGAVTAIAFIQPAIRSTLSAEDGDKERGRLWRVRRNATSLVIMTFGILMFTGPLAVRYFHRISVASPLANLLFIPLFGYVILPFGLGGVLFHFTWPLAGDFLMSLGLWTLDWTTRLVEYLGGPSWVDRLYPTPTIVETLLIMGLFISGAAALDRRFARRRMAAIAAAVISAVLIADAGLWYLSTRSPGTLQVTYLDVGDGSLAVARLPDGKTLVIDAGPRFSGFDSGERILGPYLLRERVMSIDAVAISHPHRDHVGGLRWLMDNFRVKEVWMADVQYPDNYSAEITGPAKGKAPIRRLSREYGEFYFGGAKVEVWWPPKGRKAKDVNNASLVFRLKFRGVSFLFPGDIEKKAQKSMFAGSGDYQTTAILAPHHGAEDAVTALLVNKLKPHWAVISSRYSSYHRFPAPRSVELLEQSGAKTLRTDRRGAIRLTSDGQSVQVEAWDGKRFRRIGASE